MAIVAANLMIDKTRMELTADGTRRYARIYLVAVDCHYPDPMDLLNQVRNDRRFPAIGSWLSDDPHAFVAEIAATQLEGDGFQWWVTFGYDAKPCRWCARLRVTMAERN